MYEIHGKQTLFYRYKKKTYCKLKFYIYIYMLQWIMDIWVSHGQVLCQWIYCCVLWEKYCNKHWKTCLLKPQYFSWRTDEQLYKRELFFPAYISFYEGTMYRYSFYICNVWCEDDDSLWCDWVRLNPWIEEMTHLFANLMNAVQIIISLVREVYHALANYFLSLIQSANIQLILY